MSKYYSKYLKYKIKYNKLLSSIGGRPDLLSELKPVLQYSDTCIENMKIVLLKMGKKSGDIITKDEFEIIKTQFKIYQPHASISDIRACIKDYHNMKIDPENFNKLSIRPFKEITGDITLSDTTSIMTTNKVSLRQVINSFVPIIPKKDMDKIIEMLDKEDRTRFFDNFETCRIADNSKCKIYVVTGNSLLKVPVFKGAISFFGLKSKLVFTSSDSESLDLTYSIRNTGNKIISSNPIVLKYVYDRNNSGTADPKDLVAYIDTQYLNLAKNGVVSINKKIKVKAGLSCALFVLLDSASCSCNFVYSKFPIPALKNAGVSKSVCSGDTMKIGIGKVNGYRYLWSPGIELNDDTISNPFGVFNNSDTGKIRKQFILTTYRGQCNSKDTTFIDIYKLPQISILQNDTTVCSGQKVLLKTLVKSSNGGLRISWTPNYKITDTTSYNPTVQAQKETKYKATLIDSKNCYAMDSISIFTKARRPSIVFLNSRNAIFLVSYTSTSGPPIISPAPTHS